MLLLLLIFGMSTDGDVLAIRGGKILTVTHGEIESGTVVVRDGKIVAVGPVDEVEIPEGAKVRDATGMVVIPGLVDSHSHIGIYPRPAVEANSDGNEGGDPVQPLLRAIDAIYPADPGIRMARAGGITTANVMPGSGNVMGGQTAYIKLRGSTVEEMLIDLGERAGGMKMANGENPKRPFGEGEKGPQTRMKIAALAREIFVRGQEYREKHEKRDLSLEPVVEILEGKRTVHFHTHRADDILSAMRLAEEFGFEVVLHHVTEAYLVADEIARRGVPVSLILVDSPGGKLEATRLSFENPGLCEKAGVKVALHTDDSITQSRLFLRAGGLAVRGGMSREGALRALTIHGAEMMHLEDRVGSIEVGKDGDLVLLSGDPFSVYTKVMATYIEGELVFDRGRAQDLRYATGGFGLGDRYPDVDLVGVEAPSPVVAPDGRGEIGAGGFAVAGGRIYTCAGDPIEDGMVLVEDGKIRFVGSRGDVEIPDGWPVVSAAVVTPGLIDLHSSAGLSGMFNVPADQDQDELVDPVQAHLRVVDGFNPREPLLRYLLGHGVTTIQCLPGPGNPIAGQGSVLRTVGETVEEMLIREGSAMVFNLGEGPKRVYGEREKAPSTRMGTASLIRGAFVDASNPRDDDEDEDVGRELKREALRKVLDGSMVAIFVSHREDDILTAMRLAEEFDLKWMLSQATEGYLVADRLRDVPVIVHPTLEAPGRMETMNASYENAGILRASGVPVCVSSGFEGYVPKTHVVLFEAALAAVNGLGREGALRAVTIEPARVMGIDERLGSLEAGKIADLVLYDGDPFEYTSHVQKVIVAGRVVHE